MPYLIDIYFQALESVGDIGAALGVELRARHPSIAVDLLALTPGAPSAFTEEWAAYILDTAGSHPPEGLLVEIWNDSEMMRHRLDELRDEVADPRMFQMNAVAVITLSGSTVDWPVVGSIWRTFSSRWPSIAYDDVSGFDIDLSDLP